MNRPLWLYLVACLFAGSIFGSDHREGVCPKELVLRAKRAGQFRESVSHPSGTEDGAAVVSTEEPGFCPDSGLWGISASERDRAVAALVEAFGEAELCGIFLIGSRACGRRSTGGMGRPTAASDADFVLFLRSDRSHRAELERARGALQGILRLPRFEIHGMTAECCDCPATACHFCAVTGDIPGQFFVLEPRRVPLPLEASSTHGAIRLWP